MTPINQKTLMDEVYKRLDKKFSKRLIKSTICAFHKVVTDKLKHKDPIEIGSFFSLQMIPSSSNPELCVLELTIDPKLNETLLTFYKPYET